MARSRLKLNWKQRRFVRHLLDCGNGAEAARRAKYAASQAKDRASKLLLKPWLLIFALRLDERRRLRRRLVATDAVATLSNKTLVVLDGRGERKPDPEEQAELLRHRERLQRLPPEPEIRPMLRAPAPPPLELAPAFADLLQPSRYKAVHGGRGSGKSHVFAELLVRRCVEAAPVRAVCIREVQRSLDQSVKRLLEDKIQALGLGPAFTVQADRILTPGGGRIIFQGMQNHTAESIKSLEGYDIAWVEEAQSLSKRSLELLRPTIRKTGSELWFSWNPTRPDDPVDQLFRGGPAPPGTVLIEANWSANPHFPKVLQAEMEWDRERDPDKYQHVWLGGYRRVSEARVFRNWRVEAFETPADARFLFGADWGFARDPTVLVRCFLKGRTLYVDHEAYRVGCEIDRTPALFDTVPEARRWPIVADGARPETISYMQRHGFPRLRAAAKGGGSVKEGVEFLKSCDILVHPRCRHLIDELALFSWRTDPKTGETLPELEDRENHAIDALRYALEGQRKQYGSYDSSLRWVG
ncbi:PBSX family phage terminase large subunit [Inquilinus limosus]|uniref:PBSX family phage terminase large subunit n=1 Tax=Inquilinus limosus TaxID=171674 RepID=UPI0009DB6F87|nr:PBSX family phage terminase large subunit [Inquilinus limosus]